MAAAELESAGHGVSAAGPPEAPAIVFVHGTRLTRAVWTPQHDALSDEFRTISLDLPGHGARADETFSLEGAADLLAATIREQAADGRAVVVGLSLGGYVAMTLAARQPALIRGLVIAGASADPEGLRSLPFRALAIAMARFGGPRMDGISAWFFRNRFPPEIAEPIVAGGFWSVAGARAMHTLYGRRFARELAAYPGPALILNGELDLFFRATAPGFAAAAGGPPRGRLAGALHLSNLDRPAAFNGAVRAFARSLVPA